jgi:hypothetical protein
MTYRRQRQQYIFAGFLAVIAVVNVLFFFILNRPTRLEYERLEASIRELEAQAGGRHGHFKILETTSSQLDRFDKDKKALLENNMLPRESAYSKVVETLNAIAQRTGVRKTQVNYNLDPTPRAGLNTVSITFPLEGSYSSIVNFIREIEESETLFVIAAIDLQGSSRSGVQTVDAGGSVVALSLALETYFYQ